MILLLDGDIILYRAACVHEKSFDFGGCVGHVLDKEAALQEVDNLIEDMLEKTGCEGVLVALSALKPNFRYTVLPSYKHNRAGKEKPALWKDCRDHLISNYDCLARRHLEGDDIIGIYLTAEPEKYLCATIDKDLRQVPGLHWEWKEGGTTEVTQAEGDRFFLTQVLTGDPTDGYKGCPGVGPKKAEKLLNEVLEGVAPEDYIKTAWPAIVKAYENKDLAEEDAIVQARCAYILRNGDYDEEAMEVILWEPPVI